MINSKKDLVSSHRIKTRDLKTILNESIKAHRESSNFSDVKEAKHYKLISSFKSSDVERSVQINKIMQIYKHSIV